MQFVGCSSLNCRPIIVKSSQIGLYFPTDFEPNEIISCSKCNPQFWKNIYQLIPYDKPQLVILGNLIGNTIFFTENN